MTSDTPASAPHDDWLLSVPVEAQPVEAQPVEAQPAASPPDPAPVAPRRWVSAAQGAALLLTGLAVGGGLILATSHGTGTSQTASTARLPGGLGAPGQGPPGGLGAQGRGLQGEQRVSGTLSAIGSSTVTVATTSGSVTYAITSVSEIVRNGAAATLAQLKVGDPVFLHVYPAASGTTMLVERLFAGDQAGLPAGPGGPPPQQTGTRT